MVFREVVKGVHPTVLQILDHVFDHFAVVLLLVREALLGLLRLVLLLSVEQRPSDFAKVDMTFKSNGSGIQLVVQFFKDCVLFT